MEISILKVHVTKPSTFVYPNTNLLENLHPTFIFPDGSVAFQSILVALEQQETPYFVKNVPNSV